MSNLDVKTQNLMGIFANIIEHIPHDQLNELVQASLQDNADKKAIHPSKNQWGQIYNDDYVVMQNRMLHAISHLNLNERRLVLMLATVVRGAVELNPTQKTFIITAEEFGTMFEIPQKDSMKRLKACQSHYMAKCFTFGILKPTLSKRKSPKKVSEWMKWV
ncbi:Protein involved in initiation of plasmid replication [Moraxella catarrhalis]|nr:RepB family plasmid replication initiator protein [Moraxella catarrhalis]STY80800.1 Protein involved in initiation of plasmid replication [Moraxella catarrhalis]